MAINRKDIKNRASTALPFNPLIPNETTVMALKEGHSENLPQARTIAELKAALYSDD